MKLISIGLGILLLTTTASAADFSFQRTATKYSGVYQAVEVSGKLDIHSVKVRQTSEPAGDSLAVNYQASFQPEGKDFTVFGSGSYLSNQIFDQEYLEAGAGIATSVFKSERLELRPSLAFLIRGGHLITSMWFRAWANYKDLAYEGRVIYIPELPEFGHYHLIEYKLTEHVSLGYRYEYQVLESKTNWTDSAVLKLSF